jgi:hypothetical protein
LGDGPRSHHEVLDEELAPAIEQLGERHLARGSVEDIGLLDLDPGECATLLRQPVAEPRQFLLFASSVRRASIQSCFVTT